MRSTPKWMKRRRLKRDIMTRKKIKPKKNNTQVRVIMTEKELAESDPLTLCENTVVETAVVWTIDIISPIDVNTELDVMG